MERLTIKEEWVDYAGFTNDKHNYRSCSNYSVEKLGQLEDIEEELGIDLITLFKALKDGILVNKGKWWFPRVLLVYMILDEEYAFICDDYIYKLKDYGNTWSLRKADLEDEKED